MYGGGAAGPGPGRGIPQADDGMPKPRNYRQTVCTYWLRGLCMKGDTCGFLHQFDPERMPVCRSLLKFGVCKEPGAPLVLSPLLLFLPAMGAVANRVARAAPAAAAKRCIPEPAHAHSALHTTPAHSLSPLASPLAHPQTAHTSTAWRRLRSATCTSSASAFTDQR